MGLPQNPILITKFISKIELLDNISFKIIGSGTEFKYVESHIIKNNISKTKILRSLTKASYFEELDNSDVGLIFLNEKFTIPNYPSRLLDYLYYDLAILSNTDSNTDIGEIIVKENLGKSFYGMRDLDNMISEIIKLRNTTYLKSFNNNSQSTLIDFFNIETTFNLIDNKFKND